MEPIEGHFKATRWTTVLRAGQPDAPGADAALERLCLEYRQPLLQFARRWLGSSDEADDLTQGFFVHFIANNLPGAVNRERGKFRSFLLGSFKNYMRDQWRKQKRAREIPTELLSRIDACNEEGQPAIEPAFTPQFDRELDVLWARTIRQRVVQQLEADYSARRKGALFAELLPLLLGRGAAPYSEISSRVGLSDGALKVEVHRLRGRFRDAFRGEVAETVSTGEELDSECRYLLSILFADSGEEARP